MVSIINRCINYYKRKRYLSNSERFVEYLRNCGIKIGEGCKFRPKTTSIDLSRPSLVTIGHNCYMNENFTLLTHDWVSRVFIYSGRDFINSSGHVKIGNNVSFGQNVMILKGVTIGDNVFIGAGSIVTKDIPSNCVAVGIPCKKVYSLDDYYEKRKAASFGEAVEYARSIKECLGREPRVEDFWEEFPLFLSGVEISKCHNLPVKRQLGPAYEHYCKHHKARFDDFEDFISAVFPEQQ